MGLSDLQRRVVATFFALPESEGFVLAGGAALLAHRVVDRTTRDLDLFTTESMAVMVAADALLGRLRDEGLDVVEVRRHTGFARLLVTDADATTEVDLAVDSSWRPPVASPVGPTPSLEELAVDKLLALCGRAEARDFVDVHVLAERFSMDHLLAWAPEKDTGFSTYRLAEALGHLAAIPRDRFEVDDETFTRLTASFGALRADLVRRSIDPT